MFSIPPQAQSSSGTLTGLCSTLQLSVSLIPLQSTVFHFSSVFPIPFLFTAAGKTFHVRFFFFPFLRRLEAVGGQNQASLVNQEFFGTGWAFLCPVSLAPIPKIQKAVAPQPDSRLMFEMH